jgi:hypothetical protein
MDIRRILGELRSEQEGLEKAIRALEPLQRPGTRHSNVVQMTKGQKRKTGGRKPMSAASRRRLSLVMKRRWAQRKAQSRAA